MSKVIVKSNRYTVEPLYQWDLNQVLTIHGLSLASIPEIHFTNTGMDRAIVKQATMDDAGVISADVPNSLLQKPYTITAYVCIYEGDTFKSLYAIEIPVKARKKPGDYTLENDEELYSFNAMKNQIENLVSLIEDHNQVDDDLTKKYNELAEKYRKTDTDLSTKYTKLSKNVTDQLDGFSKDLDYIKTYVTPQMFGAVGDGVTDDTEALQTAFDNSNTIFLPNGIYLISELTISKPIRIVGESKTNTILKYTGEGKALTFKPSEVTTSNDFLRVEVENIKIVTDNAETAIFMNETVHSIFKNILIDGIFTNGFEMNGESNLVSRYNTIYNNHFEEITIKNCNYGFNIFGCISDSHFTLISISKVKKGVYIHGDYDTQGSNNVTFTNSTIVWSEESFEIDGCHFRNLHISGCNFELFDNYGVKIDPGDSDIKNISIINSFFMPSTKATENTECVRLNDVSGGIINNLLFQNTISGVIGVDTTGSFLLHVDSLVTNNGSTITHNISNGCYYHSYVYDNNLDTQVLNVGFKAPRITTTGGMTFVDNDDRLHLNFVNGNILASVDGEICYMLSNLSDTVIKSLSNVKAGSCVMNDTLGKPVFYTGSKWVDANGSEI